MSGILSFFQRTPEACRRLEEHRARLFRIAYAWTHNRAVADDLAQETLARAIQKCDQLRDPKAAEAWLYSILANCFRDHFRRLKETDDVDEIDVAHERTPEQDVGELDLVQRVRAAIARLPEGQRQVVTLVDLQGCSYVEVAQILGVPIGTVMSRLCRARGALKELLVYLREESPRGHTRDAATPSGARIRRIK